jgi:hypothetical protein
MIKVGEKENLMSKNVIEEIANDDYAIQDKNESSSLERNKIDDQLSLDQNHSAPGQEQMIPSAQQKHIIESMLPHNQSPEAQSTLIDKLPNVIVVPDDEQLTAAESQSAKNASIAAKLKEICENIRTPGFLLRDEHIEAFTNMDKKMITVLQMQNPELYVWDKNEAKRDDVQIIFEGKAGGNNIGHYICIHYKVKDHMVYIYDSLHHQTIAQTTLDIIHLRYQKIDPKVSYEFVEPRTRQRDAVSCGVFAIAYATTILLGQDPAKYPLSLKTGPAKYQTSLLRNHLAKMIEKSELSLFPRERDCRVIVEKLSEQQLRQLTGSNDELNTLQNSATDVPDDAHEVPIECADLERRLPNGKRKIDEANAGGSLMKKTKSESAVRTAAFTCDICGYIARDKYNINVHMRKHSGERPDKCGICKESFYCRSTLSRHMRTKHGNTLKFECSNCDEEFRDQKECKSHESVCTIKRSTRIRRLKKDLECHMVRNTGEKPYCSHCKKLKFALYRRSTVFYPV